MEIKNLSQLKRAIKEGRNFIIRKHYIRPEYDGQNQKTECSTDKRVLQH